MYPELFTIGPYTLYTYGILMFTGVVAGVFFFRRLATRSGIDPTRVTNFGIVLVFIGYFSTKFLYMLTRLWREGFSIEVVWDAIRTGGLVWYGSFIVFPLFWWYLRKHRLPVWKAFDALTPGIALGYAIGRIGCFMGGCCYGKPTDSWTGVCVMSNEVTGVPLHPTQLYESGSSFLTFIFLLYLFRVKRFDGQVFLTYMLIYPVMRSVIELFRGDLIRGFIIEGVLSTSQSISIVIVIIALTALFMRLRVIKMEKP